jgi:hypothetical protein
MPTVSKNKKTKRTKRTKRFVRGGHEHEDKPHYHLLVKMPYGQTFELGELFAYSDKGKYLKSATVGILKQAIIDRQWGSTRFMKHGLREPREFTLFWRGKALLDPSAKIRRIVADGKKLEQYVPNNKEPIMLVFDDDLEYPGIVETDYDADASS